MPLKLQPHSVRDREERQTLESQTTAKCLPVAPEEHNFVDEMMIPFKGKLIYERQTLQIVGESCGLWHPP